MIKFVGQDELKAIREHADCDFPFGEAEDDVRKLLEYIDCLENMPLVKTIIKLQEENERLRNALIAVESKTHQFDDPDYIVGMCQYIAQRAIEGANS